MFLTPRELWKVPLFPQRAQAFTLQTWVGGQAQRSPFGNFMEFGESLPLSFLKDLKSYTAGDRNKS